MKNIFFTIIFIVSLFIPSTVYAANSNTLNILFTHDLHDHIKSYNSLENDVVENIGGYERIDNQIKSMLKEDENTLVLDAGDYSMGTLFQTIYDTENPSLRLLGEMNYDATTLGNHEFDYGAKGLTNSLIAAKNSGDKLPELLVSNIDFTNFENVNKKEVKDLENAFNELGVKEYTIIEKNGLKIGLFGVLGYEAISNSPMAGVNFSDPIEKSKEITAKLKEENADLIICLSHTGTNENKKKSEDEIMAKEVPDIDLIISGHSHTELPEPIVIGDTAIVASGNYGMNIGKIKLEKSNDKWEISNYELEKLNNSIETTNITNKIKYFEDKVQEQYLDQFNLGFNEIIGKSDFNFTSETEFGKKHEEDTLGNLISDAYCYSVKEAEGKNYKPVTAAIVPRGTVRASLTKGDITVSDAFNISSLGIGPDNISGYPLIEVYLTGEELKTTAEVDASIQPLMDEVQLYMSGVNFTFNPNRLIFNKVTDINVVNSNGKLEKVKDDELYRVVTGMYSAKMLSLVEQESFGLMSIIPKDENGKEIVDFDKHIIYDTNGNELKEWCALANYIQSFEKEDGVPKVPDKYSSLEGRKIVDDNKNIVEIIKNPNDIGKKLYGIITGILVVIIMIVVFIFKRHKKRK